MSAVTPQEIRAFRKLVGQLLWLASMRRDIAFAVKELSKKTHASDSFDVASGSRVLRYLAGTWGLKTGLFPKSGPLEVTCYCDADLGGCEDTLRSTSGGLLLLSGCVVHSWSKQQPTVALSSAEAEFTALARGASEAIYMKNVLEELGHHVPAPVLLTDSKAAVDMTKKRVVGRVKHLDRRIFFVRELVDDGKIVVRHIAGASNPADILTKHVDRATLERHRPAVLGLVHSE